MPRRRTADLLCWMDFCATGSFQWMGPWSLFQPALFLAGVSMFCASRCRCRRRAADLALRRLALELLAFLDAEQSSFCADTGPTETPFALAFLASSSDLTLLPL